MGKPTYDELLKRLADTLLERDGFASRWLRERERRDSSVDWYNVRLDKLREHFRGTEHWETVNCILANGQASIHDHPPDSARVSARKDSLIKRLEKRVLELEAENARLKHQQKLARFDCYPKDANGVPYDRGCPANDADIKEDWAKLMESAPKGVHP